MRFHAKQVIDYWLGNLLLLILFPPVRILGRLLRRDHTMDRRQGCVVIKLVGAGSLFLATPSLQAIRSKFPKGQFFLIGTSAITSFAKRFEWFDECWTIDDASVTRLLVSTVKVLYKSMLRCDHLIDLEVHSRLTVILSVLTAVRNRIGFVDESVFWRRGFYTHMNYFNSQGPVYLFYDTLAAWFGIERVAVTQVNAAFRARVLATPLPKTLQLPARFVVVAPGCSDFGKERQLDAKEWLKVLSDADLDGAACVLLGAAADRQLCEAVTHEFGHGQNLSGELSIAESAAVLAQAERFFGIDSLLLHLARSLGVPATSVWGPSDPVTRLRPGMANELVYYSKMCCSPCIHVHETPPCHGARPCIPAALAGSPQSGMPTAKNGVAIGWAIGPRQRTARAVEVTYE